MVTPKGVPHLALCSARATRGGPWSKLKEPPPQRKIGVTSKTPVGVISVVTLIRTDTTLDYSQKAEKVWRFIAPTLPVNINMGHQAIQFARILSRAASSVLVDSLN